MPQELSNTTANTTPFENDLAAFLNTLSKDVVMSFVGLSRAKVVSIF